MRESGTINFNQKYPGLSAADAWVGESREEYQMDKMNGTENRAEIEELSIKFGKGLAEPFTARDGTEYIQKRAACTARNIIKIRYIKTQ